MKRILFILVFGAVFNNHLHSAPLSPQEALERIGTSRVAEKVRGLYTSANSFEYSCSGGHDTWYAFNGSKGGWVILSGDDTAAPVLGYSDTGSFEYNALPEAMKWWLKQYTAEIREYGRTETPYSYSESTDRRVIAPMLKTAWDQGSPFNIYTPEIDGAHTPTGCVATAMAQFMKYYNYPDKGTGSINYVMNGNALSMDFDTVAFQWKDMIDVYRADATEEQKIAVSKLMQACGYAVESVYEEYATSASVYYWLRALVQNFDYAPSSRLVSRIYMNNTDWENTIYGSLSAGKPVLYSGLGSSGGHAFVCDGYSSGGYFHFNWGWSGLSNGYFLLSALNPSALGTGGGAGGFNIGQIALVDGCPNFNGSVLTPHMGLLQNTQISYSNVSKNFSITGGGLMNHSAILLSARPGFEIECPDGSLIYAGETNAAVDFPVAFTLSTYARKASVALPDGTYRVRPAFGINEGDSVRWYRADVPVSSPPYWTLSIVDGKGIMEAHDANADVDISDLRLTTGMYCGSQFKVAATIENKGSIEFMNDIYVMLYRTDGSKALTSTANPVDLMPGEKDDIEFTVNPSGLSAGEYLLSLALPVPNSSQSFTEISPRIKVEIKPFQREVELKATEFYVENAQAVNQEKISLHVSMTCVKGNYASPIRLWIRPADVTTGSWGQMIQTNHIYLNEGESTSFVYAFEYPVGVSGVTYTLLSNYVIPESQAWFGSCEFTIGSAAGVDATEDDYAQPACYYNLQGQKVENPTKGIYIMIKGGKSKKVVL